VVVCALGDATLDVTVLLGSPLAAGGDAEAEIHLSAGGQAANVAAWAAALRAEARLVCKRGDDTAGRLVTAELEERGVLVFGPAEGRNGVVCVLVGPDGERSMAPDRGVAAELRAEEVDPLWLDGCDHLFVSGYALFQEPARGAALRAAGLAHEAGTGVSLDLSSWSALEAAGVRDVREAVALLAPEVVFANEEEERAFGDVFGGAISIVKRGARGCTFDGVAWPAHAVDRVVDSTGAGDALAAGWIVGGPELALETAARCVERVGAMP
jgi:sugar/nucleoside kinase (ribokinase family)